ncbi:MAG: OmpA/MotB family protein [Bacteroidia bacterium]
MSRGQNPQRRTPVLEEAEGNLWQGTYMDTKTLLLAFFVVLSSLSTQEMAQVMITKNDSESEGSTAKEEVKAKEEEAKAQTSALFYPIQSLTDSLNQTLSDPIERGLLSLQPKDYEIRLLFSGSSFFNLGEADLLPMGKNIVGQIVKQLTQLKDRSFKIDVEGHTDGAPITTVRFKNNWELSAARASGVVRYFLEAGIPADKLKASGYADTFKLVEDRDSNGAFIPDKQDQNRRIVIRLYYE